MNQPLLVSDRYPWDLQENEGMKAFSAFQIYRDLGPKRTFVEVAKITNNYTASRIGLWANKYNWQWRAEEYDRFMDKQYTDGLAKEVRDMGERHARLSRIIIEKVLDRVEDFDVEELSAGELIKWFDVAAKIERISRGEATSHIKTDSTSTHNHNHNHRIDLSKLSDDEFDQIQTIIMRAGDGGRFLPGESEKTKE